MRNNWLKKACAASLNAHRKKQAQNNLRQGITIINQGGKTRYIGITAEADRLGVSREFLWKVLTGQATSARVSQQVIIRNAA